MDQTTVVRDQTENGRRLIDALIADGFDVTLAFWMKPTAEEAWYLYLASPFVDMKGDLASYQKLHKLTQQIGDPWLESLKVRLIRTNDALAQAAAAVVQPRSGNGSFTAQPPKPYPGMTWYHDSTLGGMDIDGAYIYPPPQPVSSP